MPIHATGTFDVKLTPQPATMTITIAPDGRHSYTLDYTLAGQP